MHSSEDTYIPLYLIVWENICNLIQQVYWDNERELEHPKTKIIKKKTHDYEQIEHDIRHVCQDVFSVKSEFLRFPFNLCLWEVPQWSGITSDKYNSRLNSRDPINSYKFFKVVCWGLKVWIQWTNLNLCTISMPTNRACEKLWRHQCGTVMNCSGSSHHQWSKWSN